MASAKIPLIVVLGPTASGKTALAVELAKRFNGELVNADSRQVYKGMDIATNKEGRQARGVWTIDGVPTHLIDVATPDQEFTLANYLPLARQQIEVIYKSGRLPILVGGTGLYIDAVCLGYSLPQGEKDAALRAKLNRQPLASLVKKLQQKSPELASQVDLQNKRRVVRALEIALASGADSTLKRVKPPYKILYLAPQVRREELYERINSRVDSMVELGLVAETKRLLKKYAPELPAMSGIGYKQLIPHLAGKTSLVEALDNTKKDTRHYAKRQLTWFKRNKRIHWVKNQAAAVRLVKKFLTNSK